MIRIRCGRSEFLRLSYHINRTNCFQIRSTRTDDAARRRQLNAIAVTAILNGRAIELRRADENAVNRVAIWVQRA